ncbi:MAG: SufD family Fe-S cluster assembly protein [PS1 clade bacterium]|nr:SufD family Fe-S cluster assembly protein [PS1 clade bacterium]
MLDATAHFDALRDRLPGDAEMSGYRAEALAYAEQAGVPTRRHENWHYTDLSRLLKNAATGTHDATGFDASSLDPLTLEFTDGVLASDLTELPAAVHLQSYEQAVASGAYMPDLVSDAETGSSTDAMTAFNFALAQDGVVMRVIGTPAQPVELLMRGDASAHIRHNVHVTEGALTLIENAQAGGYTNAVMDIDVAAGAHVSLIRLQTAGDHIGLTRVNLAEGASFCAVTFVLGGRLARHETRVRLQGEAAEADVHGAMFGHGSMHIDMTSQALHETANTNSLTTLHAVLDDASQGVFQGKVVVDRDAQHVDAQQQSRAMMLSERAQMSAKPELEIYADDVACAHGAALGELDADALFFLRSRGIDEASARHLLISGFLAAPLAHIKNQNLRALVRRHLGTHVPDAPVDELELTDV